MRALPLALASLIAATVPALADTVPERAKKLAAEGRAAHEAGDYDRAIANFTEANALAPSPALLFNLAQAYRLKGSCDDAAVMYRRYLATIPPEDARVIAQGQLETTERCSHKLALSIPLEEQEKVVARPASATVVRDRAREADGVSQQRLGLGLMIGGGLALVASGYFAWDAHSAQNDVEDAYAAGKPGAEIAPIDKRGQHAEKLAWGFGVGGGAVFAGGVVSYIYGRRMEQMQSFAYVPAKGGGGVSYSWKF
ncbi:MAG TPA: tetratricopeptide repeat protein [Kofleriaceae bacterium]|jgi:tetratricopeptide (TPR) repeat protein